MTNLSQSINQDKVIFEFIKNHKLSKVSFLKKNEVLIDYNEKHKGISIICSGILKTTYLSLAGKEIVSNLQSSNCVDNIIVKLTISL